MFKDVRQQVPKAIARRRVHVTSNSGPLGTVSAVILCISRDPFLFVQAWKKFGEAEGDNPRGPDHATTVIADEVYLTLTTNKEVSYYSPTYHSVSKSSTCFAPPPAQSVHPYRLSPSLHSSFPHSLPLSLPPSLPLSLTPSLPPSILPPPSLPLSLPPSQQLEHIDDDPLKKLSKSMVTCRICKGDHWTTKCPYKDTLGASAMVDEGESALSTRILIFP